VVSFTLHPLYTWENIPQYPLRRPQSQSGVAEKRKIFYHSHESKPNSSANQPIPYHYTDLATLTLLIHTEKANQIGLSESN
jgi:hypothetical protein